jgi:SAM-dependent methyltransferase
MVMLHVAPEDYFRPYFFRRFAEYQTADLIREDVDHNVDLQDLPFRDAFYDFVVASHVLEHIPDDLAAIKEVGRILKPGGVAILPVPLVAEHTIEYGAPSPREDYHYRAPGYRDYFDRYASCFSQVELYSSADFDEKYQLYIYEDRNQWPNETCPMRKPMAGERHRDVVPVCRV